MIAAAPAIGDTEPEASRLNGEACYDQRNELELDCLSRGRWLDLDS
jgi:hypothetical protein